MPTQKPDPKSYIGSRYGTALPPRQIDGKWYPDYQPFGPIFESWEDYREYL